MHTHMRCTRTCGMHMRYAHSRHMHMRCTCTCGAHAVRCTCGARAVHMHMHMRYAHAVHVRTASSAWTPQQDIQTTSGGGGGGSDAAARRPLGSLRAWAEIASRPSCMKGGYARVCRGSPLARSSSVSSEDEKQKASGQRARIASGARRSAISRAISRAGGTDAPCSAPCSRALCGTSISSSAAPA